MKGLILTCKHHDGFCLWPSAFTEHSVKNSAWKQGKGDVVRELSDACREFGLEFGVYLSPWDRNHARYGGPEYIVYFRNQLRELLTQYGPIFEVWFDGANGGDGYYGGARERRTIDPATYYDWENTWQIVRELQPAAVIFSDAGPDVRWIGNESGLGSETTWCLLSTGGRYPGGVNFIGNDLGEGHENGTHWLPPEADVSIRAGWFHHAHEDARVKSAATLLDIYYRSVGRGSTLLLNLPPDRRGLIHENDVDRLQRFQVAREAIFANDLARDAAATASNVRGQSPEFGAANVIDGRPDTYWAADDGVTEATVELVFPGPLTFNNVVLQEHIALGQRVQAWKLEARSAEAWRELSSGTTIGYKRILSTATVKADGLRLLIVRAKACPTLTTFGAYLAPVLMQDPSIRAARDGKVTLSAGAGAKVRYTIDGSTPTPAAPLFDQPFDLPRGGTVMAVAFPADNPGACGLGVGPVVTRRLGLAKARWHIVETDSQETKGYGAENAIDGDPGTIWHTEWIDRKPDHPHHVTIDLGEVVAIGAFSYLPRQDQYTDAIVERYAFYASLDGRTWGAPAAEGRFDNLLANPVEQFVSLAAPVKARFVMFVSLGSVQSHSGPGSQPCASAAGIDVFLAT
jgi:alpha-L-fucosidase